MPLAVVNDPHAPKGEQNVEHPDAGREGISPVLAALRSEDAATASQRLAAVVESQRIEQAAEDALGSPLTANDSAQRAEAEQQLEAAIDDAIDLSRVIEGRYRRNSLDTRRRRAILAILASQTVA